LITVQIYYNLFNDVHLLLVPHITLHRGGATDVDHQATSMWLEHVLNVMRFNIGRNSTLWVSL